MTLEENIARVRQRIAAAAQSVGRSPAEITLVAATKVQSCQTIRAAIAAGITVCGENRVQEMTAHMAEGAYQGAKLHFIGHLQTNKVKYVAGKVDMIESVDSPRLLLAIEERCAALDVRQDILLEVNIGGEAAKSGLRPDEVAEMAQLALKSPHIRLRGLMTVPPVAPTPEGNREFFAKTCQLFVDIKQKLAHNRSDDLDCLSMGMSGDFEEAIRQGATHVRVGTALFGPRPPKTGQGAG